MATECGGDIGTLWLDGEALLPRIGNHRLDQLHGIALPARLGRGIGMVGNAGAAACPPGQLRRALRSWHGGAIGAVRGFV